MDTLTNQLPTLNHVQWTRYIQVASLTLVLHDHLLTLQKEVDLVWRGANARSWPRLLFFAARYACPVALLINTVALLDTHNSDDVEVGYSFMGGRDTSFSLAYKMRLWAMYRSRKVLVAMTVFVSLALVAMGVIEGFGYSDVTVTAEPVRNLVHICGPGRLPHYVYAFWLPPIFVETVSVTLVIYKAARYFQGDTPREWAGSRFMSSIVRYSVFYFILVLAVYLANFYVWLRQPINLFELFIPLTYALPSVAGNRMLLSLREVFYADHSVLPGQDDTIGLTIVHPERGLTVHTHNPLKEFDSFFGENNT